MPPSKLPPVRTLVDWQRAANALFAAGRMPYAYSLIAMLGSSLARYLDGPCCLVLICRENAPVAWRAAKSVWRSIPEIDLGHKFSDADPPLMTMVDFAQRDPHRVLQFITALPAQPTRSMIIVHSTRVWENELSTSVLHSTVFRIDPRPLKLFPDLTPAAGLAGDVWTAYIEQPDVVAWLGKAVPALNDELFELGQRKERLRMRCRTFACMIVAAKILEDIDLLVLSAARVRVELMRRISVSAVAKFGTKKEQANEQADSETVCEAGRQGVAGPAAVGGEHDAADIDVHED